MVTSLQCQFRLRSYRNTIRTIHSAPKNRTSRPRSNRNRPNCTVLGRVLVYSEQAELRGVFLKSICQFSFYFSNGAKLSRRNAEISQRFSVFVWFFITDSVNKIQYYYLYGFNQYSVYLAKFYYARPVGIHLISISAECASSYNYEKRIKDRCFF